MESQKIYLAGNGGSDTSALLATALQNRGLDPTAVMAMLGNRGGNGDNGWGEGGFFGILLLFLLMGSFNNGNGGFGGFGSGNNNGSLPLNMLSNDSSRELIMSAIQRNGLDVSQLASTLNCSIGQVTAGINELSTQICNLAGQQGLSAQQIINSIQAGNNSLSSQLAQCCCDQRLATCQQTNTLQNAMNQNALALRDSGTSNTQAIIGKLDQMQNQALQDKIDALREKNSVMANQLSQEHQNAYFAQVTAQSIAPVNAALGDLSTRLAAIECKQPPTINVPYMPAMGSMIPVNYSVPLNLGVSTLNGCGC